MMAFKSLHDFNLETFGTEVLLTLASYWLIVWLFNLRNFARVISHLSYSYAIAADRRALVHDLLPKPKSPVLMSSHPSENSGAGICEIRKTVGRVSNRHVKQPLSE
ncbi:hypothetical protein ACVME8_010761 [Bradyrhizobium diazoefficiens]